MFDSAGYTLTHTNRPSAYFVRKWLLEETAAPRQCGKSVLPSGTRRGQPAEIESASYMLKPQIRSTPSLTHQRVQFIIGETPQSCHCFGETAELFGRFGQRWPYRRVYARFRGSVHPGHQSLLVLKLIKLEMSSDNKKIRVNWSRSCRWVVNIAVDKR